MTLNDPVAGDSAAELDVLGTLATGATAPTGAAPAGAFDAHRPPDAALLGDCVHCGFCLPTCPTYVLWGEEMDSPRGRIHLMQQGLQGQPMTDSMVGHFDACLGCMACVSACPSGVQYGTLIQQTRAQVERHHTRPRTDRLLRATIFALFPRPRLLRLLRGPLRLTQRLGLDRRLQRTGLLDRIAPRLAAMSKLAPTLQRAEALPDFAPATAPRRAVVGLLTGCVQGAFFPEVNAATVRVLQAEGCDVVIPPRQGCCGALSAHSGREDEAQRFARRLIDTFESAAVETVVVNAAGCGSSMKEYAELLQDDPDYAGRAATFAGRVRDISELLDELGPIAPRHSLEVTVAYHDACHLAHAQGIRSEPRRLLRSIPGLQLREIAEGELCCGSAGIYNILNPDAARELGDRKAGHIMATGADVLVAANPGCLMQVASALDRSDRPMRTAHTIELLDAAIRGTDPDRFRHTEVASSLPRSDEAKAV